MSEESNPWTPEATTHKCPACGSHDTRKSLPSGLFDAFVRMFHSWPYRCRKCAHRFIRRLPMTDLTVVSESDQPDASSERPDHAKP